MARAATGMATWALAALLAVSLPHGCGGAQEGHVMRVGDDGGEVRLGARDSGGRVELRVGQEFTLELRANPSTGYSWEVTSSGEPVIRPLGEPTYTEDGHRLGAPGTLRYRFRAEEAGTAELRLAYVRRWEKDARPADTFAVTLVVNR